MIKVSIDGNKFMMDMEMKGSLPELIADTITILSMIHSTIKEKSELEAEYYKQCILSEIETAFIHDDKMLKVALDNKTESILGKLVESLLIGEHDKPNETIIDEQLLAELRKAKLDENS
jgi:hypothetical protein